MELRVSEKGAVSVYGLQYYPFTLYADEWKAVFAATRVIRRFIAENHSDLFCRCDEHTCEALREMVERGDLVSQTHVGSLCCGRSKMGKVSLHGLRRFPVTLSCDQWCSVLSARAEIESFIGANRDYLAVKGDSRPRLKVIRHRGIPVPSDLAAELRLGPRTPAIGWAVRSEN